VTLWLAQEVLESLLLGCPSVSNPLLELVKLKARISSSPAVAVVVWVLMGCQAARVELVVVAMGSNSPYP
jgi:hypothetical protein